jgi:hypothetical protein
VTADQRVTAARDYLDSIRPHKPSARPHSVLVREAAELRRQLGQVLAAIADGTTALRRNGSASLSPADVVTVLGALDHAADALADRAAQHCDDCVRHPSGACESHVDDLDQAAEYKAVSGRLGDAR